MKELGKRAPRRGVTPLVCALALLTCFGAAGVASADSLVDRAAPPFLSGDVARACAGEIESAEVRPLIRAMERTLRARGVRAEQGWPRAVLQALCASGLELGPGTSALALAMIEKESSFDPHGLLPGQPHPLRKMAHRLIDDLERGDQRFLARRLGPERARQVMDSAVTVAHALGISGARIKSLFDEYYRKYHWRRLRTEWAVEKHLFADITAISNEKTLVGFALRGALRASPELVELLRSGEYFGSIGPMQVSIAAAAAVARRDGRTLSEQDIRRLLYTVQGGVYYGVQVMAPIVNRYAHAYPLSDRCAAAAAPFVATDFNGGPFSARNAAIARQLQRLTGVKVQDDFRRRSEGLVQAVRALAEQMSDSTAPERARYVARFLNLRLTRRLEGTRLYEVLKTRYASRFGSAPAYATIPRTCSYSPKGGRICLRVIARRATQLHAAYCRQLTR